MKNGDATTRLSAIFTIHNAVKSEKKIVITLEPYYQYTPQRVIENGTYKIDWDNIILGNKIIVANRPDIALIDKVTEQQNNPHHRYCHSK